MVSKSAPRRSCTSADSARASAAAFAAAVGRGATTICLKNTIAGRFWRCPRVCCHSRKARRSSGRVTLTRGSFPSCRSLPRYASWYWARRCCSPSQRRHSSGVPKPAVAMEARNSPSERYCARMSGLLVRLAQHLGVAHLDRGVVPRLLVEHLVVDHALQHLPPQRHPAGGVGRQPQPVWPAGCSSFSWMSESRIGWVPTTAATRSMSCGACWAHSAAGAVARTSAQAQRAPAPHRRTSPAWTGPARAGGWLCGGCGWPIGGPVGAGVIIAGPGMPAAVSGPRSSFAFSSARSTPAGEMLHGCGRAAGRRGTAAPRRRCAERRVRGEAGEVLVHPLRGGRRSGCAGPWCRRPATPAATPSRASIVATSARNRWRMVSRSVAAEADVPRLRRLDHHLVARDALHEVHQRRVVGLHHRLPGLRRERLDPADEAPHRAACRPGRSPGPGCCAWRRAGVGDRRADGRRRGAPHLDAGLGGEAVEEDRVEPLRSSTSRSREPERVAHLGERRTPDDVVAERRLHQAASVWPGCSAHAASSNAFTSTPRRDQPEGAAVRRAVARSSDFCAASRANGRAAPQLREVRPRRCAASPS